MYQCHKQSRRPGKNLKDFITSPNAKLRLQLDPENEPKLHVEWLTPKLVKELRIPTNKTSTVVWGANN